MITTKKFFCLVLVWALSFGSISMIGQTTPDTMSLEQQLLNAFTELDQSEITTGILYERVPEYVPLKLLDGSELPDSLAMDRESYLIAFAMYYQAQIDNTNLMSFESFVNTTKRLKDSTVNVLSGLYFAYNSFKDNVVEDSLIVVDTIAKKFYRGPNLSTSPYEEDTVLILTSFVNESNSLSQQFVFDNNLFYTNIPMGLVGAQIDFDDGMGFRTFTLGQNFNINYSDYGRHVIKIKLIGENNQILYATTYIEITPEQSGFAPLDDDDYFSDADIMDGYGGVLEIWRFKNNECIDDSIRKPLILLDGFDPTDKHSHKYVKKLLKDMDDLDEKLYNEGYDIFFINNPNNSSDDIFSQSDMFRDAIDWLNHCDERASDAEKNMVVGFSLGGVTGKIALRSMELDGVDHKTRLFCTYDGIQKGANIPLGMQCMVKHIGEYEIGGVPIYQLSEGIGSVIGGASVIGDMYNSLYSDGSKQLLYYHEASANWISDSENIDSKYTYANALESTHDAFYNQFESMGELTIPTIAIANGAIIEDSPILSYEQQFQPGDNLLDQESTGSDFFGGDVWKKIGWVTGTYFKLNVKINALPDGNGMVYDGYIVFNVLWLGFGDRDIRKVRNALPYDSCPGASEAFDGDPETPSYQPFDWKYDAFDFHPTISSIGLDDINNNHNPYFTEDLTDPNNVIPYSFCANYIGSTSEKDTYLSHDFENVNEQHIWMSEESQDFLLSYAVPLNPLFTTLGEPAILNDRTYNFGIAPVQAGDIAGTPAILIDNTIDFDLEVSYNGKLWYNRNDLIAFTDDASNPQNNSPQNYRGVITGAECGEIPIVVDVHDGGELIVGESGIGNTALVVIKQNGTLFAGSSGLIKIEDQSEIVIEDEGKLVVENGGLLNSTWGSTIRIADGGVLHVKNGGILRVQHYSDLVVEAGGKLIIDEGAKIQTWASADNTDGDARIYIKEGGELVWNGTPDYSGNGYFEFDRNHILTLNADFELHGEGQGIRMIKLNTFARLVIEDKKLKLTDGKIVYSHHSVIESKNNYIDVDKVDFVLYNPADKFVVLWGNKSKYTNIENSNFYGSLKINGVSRFDNYIDQISDCSFYSKGVNVRLTKRKNPTISNSNFFVNDISVLGTDCTHLDLVDCTMTDSQVGVKLNGVPDFRMEGGTINFILTGINAVDGYNNIALTDGATISNPASECLTDDNSDYFAAIVLDGGAYGSATNPIFYGHLQMNCSKLNAFFGVKGTNTLFHIDAIENSNGESPNAFICKYVFDVCYLDYVSDMIGTISARGNYWDDMPVEADDPINIPFSATNIYSFKDIQWDGDCGHPDSNDHPLDYSQSVSDYPTDCFERDGLVENDFTHSFSEIAKEKYISSRNAKEDVFDVAIYPNPTSSFFTVRTNDNVKCKMTLTNIFGQKVMEKTVESGMNISTNDLDNGVYIYRFTDNEENTKTGKLVIQK